MTDLSNPFVNLGMAGATLAIIWFMVKYFMKKLDEKDEYIKGLIKDFQDHVEICNANFMKFGDHFSKIADKQTKAIENLIKKVASLEK